MSVESDVIRILRGEVVTLSRREPDGQEVLRRVRDIETAGRKPLSDLTPNLFEPAIWGINYDALTCADPVAVREWCAVVDVPFDEVWWSWDATLVGGQVVRNVHREALCRDRGVPCVIHNPSEHHMRSWPMHFRGSCMERICAHGVGHPDPDDTAWRKATGNQSAGIHGCDGCCAPLAQ